MSSTANIPTDQPSDVGAAPAGFTQRREFWTLLGYAAALGVLGAVVGLAFLGFLHWGSRWYHPSDDGWFGGRWWWVALTAAAGLGVGVLRRLTRLPDKTPGLIKDLQTGHSDPALVPGILLVSAVSLVGGASLGPEKALGTTVGGAGAWISKRRGMTADETQANTTSGFAGAYGGLLSSPVIVVALILELSRPGGDKLTRTLVNTIVASSVSFGIYFAIAGSVFLDIYKVPPYAFKSWQLLAGAALGILSAGLVMLMVLVIAVITRTFARAKLPSIAKPILGGALFGLIGVALPLTLFSGSSELTTVINDYSALGLGIVLALVLAKMLAFGVASASGFIGGPIFPVMFVGGTAGVAVHMIVPGIPLALGFTCMLAAVPGALANAPFALVLLASLVTLVGPLQTAPILIAVITAYLAVAGSNFLAGLAKRAKPAGPPVPVTSA